MKAFITGISGFVGEHLSEYLLRQGVEVWGTKLPHENVHTFLKDNTGLYDLDLLDKDGIYRILAEVRPDMVFHLAAQSSVALSWKNPTLTFDVNVKGTLNLLECIRELGLGCRILLIGSSEEYGKVAPEETPVREDRECRPCNPYAVSKVSQEMMGRLYVEAYGIEIVMVRAFNHTGPRQRPVFVIPDFSQRIALMEKGKMEPVLKVGNLTAVRDFSDVRDIVRGYYSLMLRGKAGEVYNIGSGRGYRIQELLDKLLGLARVDITVEQDPNRIRPSDVPVLVCDNSKIREHTGWKPEIDIYNTLEDVLEYWRKNT